MYVYESLRIADDIISYRQSLASTPFTIVQARADIHHVTNLRGDVVQKENLSFVVRQHQDRRPWV
jgi:hypothetical protein